MKFDKTKVFTSLNADELHEGDKVIVANNLADLKEFVRQNDVHEIEDILSDCVNERFGVCGMANYSLAYLVERAEPKTEHDCQSCKYKNCGFKYLNTKNDCDMWEAKQKDEKHTDYNHCEEAKKAYVCAMTNVCPNKHYRPFRDTDELIKVWMDGGKYDYKEMPHIWVKYKDDDTDRGRLIISYSNNGCSVIDVDEIKVMLWEGLFEKCVFLDGSPCGVEE